MPKLTPEHVAGIVAERLGQAFSCSQFINLFEDHELSSGWTLGDALAAWFSLGNLALVVSLAEAFNDEAKSPLIIRFCQILLPKHWGMSNEICAKFRVLIERTEAAAFASFNACKDGTELLVFFFAIREQNVGYIAAHLKMNYRLSDIRLQTLFLAASVCGLFVKQPSGYLRRRWADFLIYVTVRPGEPEPSYGTDIARRCLRTIRKRVPNPTGHCCSHTSADLRAACSGWPELPEVASDVNTGIAEYVMGLALRAIDSAYRGAA
jgi:hypothetical protein